MILLEGHHSVLEMSTIDFGIPVNTLSLHIKGNGRADSVIIHGLSTGITATMVIMENFTALATSLIASKLDLPPTNITILNCNFIESIMILTNVNFNIKDSNFLNSTSTAISLYSGTATFMGYVRFVRNKGFQGGALMLVGTTMKVAESAKLYFKENHAIETGGAIFVVNSEMVINTHGYRSACFYQLLDYDNDSTYSLEFINNSANKGGDHIYGASLNSDCLATSGCTCLYNYQVLDNFFWFDPGYQSTFSAVSADATRVCTCDVNGQPQCDELIVDLQTYPGGSFTIPVVLVGGDYGTTIGTVYAAFLGNSSSAFLGSSNQHHQVITTNSQCSMLNFSVHSNKSRETIFLTAEETIYRSADEYFYEATHLDDDHYDYIDTASRNTPTFINIMLLQCPPGFTLLGDPPGCDCHPVLSANGVICIINHQSGYHKWNSTSIWIQTTDDSVHDKVFFSKHCPFNYCKPSGKHISLNSSPDVQCAFNRTGILCGSCNKNYSLAIGSSSCIYCPNNNNLALLIFFAAAGVLLVLTIAALNLTVTQGMINSLVFYANIIWAYQNILFPTNFYKALIAHKTFIAWLNLDFGIQTCFINGMDAYLKAWLQFIFPFYTAGLFFLGLRYSSKLSKLFGGRSVPTLATLLFLSYSKLLRTIIACLQLGIYVTYSDSSKDGSTNVVWAIDGNLSYSQYPHIFLLLAAIVCFILLWMPYTLLLFSMQWLRKVDHHRPLRFIARYKPIYDAYFAPLKDKHHYWFGVLLFVQGVLLLVSSLTLNTFPALNLLLLLTISILLLCYINSIRTYKRLSLSLLESSFLVNFIVLTVGHLYFRDSERGRMVLLSISITIVFLEFCGIVVWNLIPQKMKRFRRMTASSDQLELDAVHIIEQHSDDGDEQYVRYGDSILDHATTVQIGDDL